MLFCRPQWYKSLILFTFFIEVKERTNTCPERLYEKQRIDQMLITDFAMLAYGALVTATPFLVRYLKISPMYYALVHVLGDVLLLWLGLQ